MSDGLTCRYNNCNKITSVYLHAIWSVHVWSFHIGCVCVSPLWIRLWWRPAGWMNRSSARSRNKKIAFRRHFSVALNPLMSLKEKHVALSILSLIICLIHVWGFCLSTLFTCLSPPPYTHLVYFRLLIAVELNTNRVVGVLWLSSECFNRLWAVTWIRPVAFLA